MAGIFDTAGYFESDGGLGGWWSAANGISADQSFVTPRTEDTVPANAIQSMQPITTGDGSTGSGWGEGWGDFLKQTLGTVVGYSIAKDAAQAGVARPAVQQYGQPGYGSQVQGTARPVGLSLGGLGPLLLVGGVVLLAVKATK